MSGADPRERRFGPYLLTEPIGRGGMAEVWKAVPIEGPRAPVAVKRLRPRWASDPNLTRAFLREERTARQLHHPNIARMIDAGEVDGTYFLAMELVDGIDLGRLIAQSGALSPGVAALVVRELCNALGYLHNFVDETGAPSPLRHRDVSPANLMLALDGSVKLIDFGTAKLDGADGSTTEGEIRGKLGYLAPEQLAGEPVDHRADLFCAGIVLHEILTGQQLFGGDRAVDRSVEWEPPAPSLANRMVPAELDRICEKALARAAGDRYQSASEMAGDLDRLCASAGVGAASIAMLVAQAVGPAGPTSTLARGDTRIRLWIAGAVVAGVALALFGARVHRAPPKVSPAALRPDAGSPHKDDLDAPLPRVNIELRPPPAATRVEIPRKRSASRPPSAVERGATFNPFE